MAVVQENRPYQRILHSDKSTTILEQQGFETVFSSNVSAIAKRGKDLIIRFHNGSIYSYPNEGNNYERLMASASKGKWVWRFLRRPNKPYQKIGSLPLPEDTVETDEEILLPRKDKYKVESIIPADFMTTGALPQILITPIEQAVAIIGGNSGLSGLLGTASMLTTMGTNNIFGIINATTALGIIKGT